MPASTPLPNRLGPSVQTSQLPAITAPTASIRDFGQADNQIEADRRELLWWRITLILGAGITFGVAYALRVPV